MFRPAATLLTIIFSLNLAFATDASRMNSDEIYGQALASVHQELSLEKTELNKFENELNKLNSELNSAKIKRNITLGIGIPVTIFAGLVSYKLFRSSNSSALDSVSNVGFGNAIPRLIAFIFGVGTSGATIASAITTGTLVYLSQDKINTIKESISVLKAKIQIKKKLIDQQLETLTQN